jgi:hypothetical protein
MRLSSIARPILIAALCASCRTQLWSIPDLAIGSGEPNAAPDLALAVSPPADLGNPVDMAAPPDLWSPPDLMARQECLGRGGQVVWQMEIGQADVGASFCVSPAGRVTLSGSFQAPLTFAGATLTASGNFLAGIDARGAPAWLRASGGGLPAVDGQDRLVLVGSDAIASLPSDL